MVVVVVLEENEVAADPDQDQAEHFQRTAAYACTNACTTPLFYKLKVLWQNQAVGLVYSCCITSWSVVVPAEKKEGFEGA